MVNDLDLKMSVHTEPEIDCNKMNRTGKALAAIATSSKKTHKLIIKPSQKQTRKGRKVENG